MPLSWSAEQPFLAWPSQPARWSRSRSSAYRRILLPAAPPAGLPPRTRSAFRRSWRDRQPLTRPGRRAASSPVLSAPIPRPSPPAGRGRAAQAWPGPADVDLHRARRPVQAGRRFRRWTGPRRRGSRLRTGPSPSPAAVRGCPARSRRSAIQGLMILACNAFVAPGARTASPEATVDGGDQVVGWVSLSRSRCPGLPGQAYSTIHDGKSDVDGAGAVLARDGDVAADIQSP